MADVAKTAAVSDTFLLLYVFVVTGLLECRGGDGKKAAVPHSFWLVYVWDAGFDVL